MHGVIIFIFYFRLKASIVKEYPAKLRVTTLQCFFSLIQSALWALVMERNPQAWKLGWNLQLFSVAYCVNISLFSLPKVNKLGFRLITTFLSN